MTVGSTPVADNARQRYLRLNGQRVALILVGLVVLVALALWSATIGA